MPRLLLLVTILLVVVGPPEFEMSPVTLAVVMRLSVHCVWAFEVGGNKTIKRMVSRELYKERRRLTLGSSVR